MKKANYKKVFLATILAAVVSMPVNCLAAPENEPGNLEALQKYDQTVTSADMEIYQRYLDRANKEWVGTYRSVWQSRRMDDVLRRRTDAAVDAEINNTGYADRIRGIWDNKVVGRVLQRSAEESQDKFGSNYRNFLNDLDDPYSRQLAVLLSDLARDLSRVRKDAASSMPGYQALVDISLNPAVAEIQTRFEMPKAQAPLTIQSGAGLAAGIGVLALRKALQNQIMDNLVRRVVGSAGRKALFAFEGPLGWAIGVGLIARDIYTIGRDIENVPEKIKAGIFDGMKDLYYVQAAQLAWTEGLKRQVEKQIGDVRDLVGGSFDSSFREFRSCSSYRSAASGLDEKDQDELLMKLYVLRSGTSMSICRLSDKLGATLPKVGTEQLNCIQKAVKTIGLDLTARWLDLGYSRICDLTLLNPEQWARFEPTSDNLDFLTWVSTLPEQQRGTALQLDRESANLIRKLSYQRQIILMRDRSAEQIVNELNRLHEEAGRKNGLLQKLRQGLDRLSESIPGFGEMRLILAGTVLIIGAIFLIYVILLLRRMVSPFKRIFFSRKGD